MNSEPICKNGNIVSAIKAITRTIIVLGRFKTKPATGWYNFIRKRLIGFLSSFGILPRMKNPMSIGTMVTARIAAAAIEYVFVNASGLNKRPSCSSRENTGKKETVMTSNDQKSDGPTSHDASFTTSQWLFRCGRSKAIVMLQMFMQVFNHDDGRVHHGADGNGDAGKRHDVGVDVPGTS